MKSRTIIRAFVVSVSLAAITTITASILSATYIADPLTAESYVVTGFEAIRLWIGAAGVSGVLKSHLGWFASVFLSTFVACLVFRYWEAGVSESDV